MGPDPQFSAWESFYVIAGAAGGALIGIQFVVITLIAQMRRRVPPETIHAFASPTVVHFASVLVVACLLTAHWPSPAAAAVALAALGFGGVGYGVVVVRRARRQSFYRSLLGDWVWYTLLPGLAYATLGGAALLLPATPAKALLAVAAAALGLLLIGIRNAWDTVTHILATDAADAAAEAAAAPEAREEKTP